MLSVWGGHQWMLIWVSTEPLGTDDVFVEGVAGRGMQWCSTKYCAHSRSRTPLTLFSFPFPPALLRMLKCVSSHPENPWMWGFCVVASHLLQRRKDEQISLSSLLAKSPAGILASRPLQHYYNSSRIWYRMCITRTCLRDGQDRPDTTLMRRVVRDWSTEGPLFHDRRCIMMCLYLGNFLLCSLCLFFFLAPSPSKP